MERDRLGWYIICKKAILLYHRSNSFRRWRVSPLRCLILMMPVAPTQSRLRRKSGFIYNANEVASPVTISGEQSYRNFFFDVAERVVWASRAYLR
jgi:hypothetical protein